MAMIGLRSYTEKIVEQAIQLTEKSWNDKT